MVSHDELVWCLAAAQIGSLGTNPARETANLFHPRVSRNANQVQTRVPPQLFGGREHLHHARLRIKRHMARRASVRGASSHPQLHIAREQTEITIVEELQHKNTARALQKFASSNRGDAIVGAVSMKQTWFAERDSESAEKITEHNSRTAYAVPSSKRRRW